MDKFISTIWILGLLLLAQPFASALSDEDINLLVDKILLYAQQTDSCINTTTGQTGTAAGTPTTQDITADITGSCDYDGSDDIKWSSSGDLSAVLNQSHCIWTDDSNSDFGSPLGIIAKGTGNGQFRMERDNTNNVFRMIYYTATEQTTASAVQPSIVGNNQFKLLCGILNITDTTNKARGYFSHNGTYTAEGAEMTSAFGVSVTDIVLNGREDESSRGIQSIAAYIIFNKSLRTDELEYMTTEYSAGRHLESVVSADPCADIDPNYVPTFSDKCSITSTIEAGSAICEISGDDGYFEIASGGDLQCNEFHILPDDFDGDTTFSILTGGAFRIT